MLPRRPSSSSAMAGYHRNRRGPRTSPQNAHRHYKPAARAPKESFDSPAFSDYLRSLEAAKSFEFDDDEIFCPFNLLTEDDLQSIHSSNSDRGSLSSGSPEGSPLQHQVQPNPAFLLPSSVPNAYHPAGGYPQQHMKLHQPMAQRMRNAIPIVDPSTRSVASPPVSVSPGRQIQQHQQQYVPRRW